MVYEYMVHVYAFLVKMGRREIVELPTEYQVPVAEYLASQIEAK